MKTWFSTEKYTRSPDDLMQSWFSTEKYASSPDNLIQYELYKNIDCDDPDVSEFLGKLSLLADVPLCDLVADDRMLPPESVRFFYIDPNWVECLLDGAMSIGRSSFADALHDRAVFRPRANGAYRTAINLRRRKRGIQNSMEPSADGKSGFMLRSALVTGFPGMELKCFENKTELTILRYDIIAEDVLICIANGCLDTVAFCEPVESVHFGFKETEQGELFRQLVSLKPGEIGHTLQINISPIFREGGKRVLNLTEFTQEIQSKLPTEHTGPYFSSLEFAAQMMNRQTRYDLSVTEDKEGEPHE